MKVPLKVDNLIISKVKIGIKCGPLLSRINTWVEVYDPSIYV